MFRNFYPDSEEDLADKFADAVSSNSDSVSAAQVQGLFMFYKHSAEGALGNAFRLYMAPSQEPKTKIRQEGT